MKIQEFKNIIQMSDKPAPRSQTADKYKKYDDPNKFIPSNVIIDSETKSPRYLTSFSASGMRRLTETQKKIYDAYIKSKDPIQIKHPQYFQIANDKKIEKAHPSKKQRQSRIPNQEDNYYQTNEFIKNKIGGGALVDKHKNYFKQIDEKKYELNSRMKEIEGVGLKKVQKKQEDKNEEAVKDPMTDSTLLIVDRAIQDIKKSEALLQGDIPKQSYFDNQFTLVLQQLKYTRQAIRLLEKSSGQRKPGEKYKQISQIDKVRAQLQQALTAKSNLQRQANAVKAKYEDLLVKFRQSQEKRKEVQLKHEKLSQLLEDATHKMKEMMRKYNDVCRMYEQLQRQSSLARHNQAKALQQSQKKAVQIKFYSSLALENNITTFLNGPIQAITKKHLKTSRLIYRKDEFNTNITNYLDRPPFPLVILFHTDRNNVFGVFAEGIQSYRTNQMKEDNTFEKPFKVFLFNATKKMIFERDQRSKVTCGLSYFENHLKFGNNQLVLKNNALAHIRILGSSIFGQKYFILPKRHLLTGEETEIIDIKEMEIFEVFFSDI